MKKFFKIFCLTSVATAMLMMTSCGNSSDNAAKTPTSEPVQTAKSDDTAAQTGDSREFASNTVLFTMEDGKTFTIVCEPEYAPGTVENFLALVNDGFYDGLTFHRVLDDFVAQGGDPSGNGTGGAGNSIKGEFSANGYKANTLTHERGSVAMARTNDPDSATSQFYICYDEIPHLNGSYAVFGKVVEGMETVDSFLEVERDGSGMPTTPIVIKDAKIVD